MKSLYIVIIILLCAYSCKNKKTDLDSFQHEFDIYQIPENLNEKNIYKKKLSQLYLNINGFALDSKGGEIGMVDKVVIFDHKLFVLDSDFAKKLFVYDLLQNGKFLFSIGDRGKGPGEFLHFTDFTIDSLNNQILTIDSNQKKISYFDLNGTFVSSSLLKFRPLNIYCQDDYLYFITNTYESNDCGLKITTRDLKIQQEFLPFKKYPLLAFRNSIFFKINNQLLLNYPYCDTIFQIKGLSISPYLAIESKNRSFSLYAKSIDLKPVSRITQHMDILKGKNKEFKNITIPKIYFEDDKVKLFNFSINKDPFSLIVSKKNNNNQPEFGMLYNDFFLSTISFLGYHNDYGTYGIVPPERMLSAQLDWLEDNKNSVSYQLIQSIQQADPNNNPYIIFLH